MKDTETKQSLTRERIWSLPAGRDDQIDDEAVDTLSRAMGITPLTARLLCNRGYTDPASAELFFGNDERVWHDPMLMADMTPAVRRVLEAVEHQESIAIYGDYDVDGVTSVTSLYLYLTGLGAKVTCYIPNRLGEGYGMSVAAVDQLAADGVSLIITVDTGITAHAEIAHAAALGVDTVVTDHHECHADIPVCCAVVNPHRPDCPYPFKELAGVGVVFKVICACEATRLGLTASEALHRMGDRLIDLVAIGTVADVMPLTDENRYIVARGLSMLDHTERPGLCALLDAISGSGNSKSASSGGKKPRRKVNSGLVGFGIAPRINAAGRIAHAMMAVDLLLADTPEHAEEMAAELCAINTHRQTEENAIAEQAYARIDAQLAEAQAKGEAPPSVIVLEDNGCFPEDYTVSLSTDGLNWVVVQDVKGSKDYDSGYKVEITLDTPVNARFIRVMGTKLRGGGNDGYLLQLGESEAYGKPVCDKTVLEEAIATYKAEGGDETAKEFKEAERGLSNENLTQTQATDFARKLLALIGKEIETTPPETDPVEPDTNDTTEPTEDPTDDETAAPTEPSDTTAAPADTTAEQTTEAPTEPAKGGCGSMIGLSVLLTLSGAALMLRKKKED